MTLNYSKSLVLDNFLRLTKLRWHTHHSAASIGATLVVAITALTIAVAQLVYGADTHLVLSYLRAVSRLDDVFVTAQSYTPM